MIHKKWVVLAGLIMAFGACKAGVLIDLDHASFRANDTLAYVEVFASVQRAHLMYASAGDSSRANFILELQVLQDTNLVLADTFAATDVLAKNEPPTKGQFFPHVFRLVMKPGRYILKATLVQDSAGSRDMLIDSTLNVRAFRDDTLAISDIELGCQMEKSDKASQFTKNGLLMLPNPTRFYGPDLPLFYYYAEAYGLDFDSSAADSYLVVHRVLSSETGSPIRPESRRMHPTMGHSVVIADGFPVSTLRTGTYELEIVVTSFPSGHTTKISKKFWTFRKDDFLTGRPNNLGSDYQARMLSAAPDVLDIVDADSALNVMKYALTSEQWKQVQRYNAEGKRTFLRTYWSEKEVSDPGAANRYFARVAEANRRWDYLHRQGWKTDRGRVFVLYGEPDLVDRGYADPSVEDHEVWHYDHLEGGVIFVFSDSKGFGDLELVHSTKSGEIYNPNWYVTSPTSGSSQGYR